MLTWSEGTVVHQVRSVCVCVCVSVCVCVTCTRAARLRGGACTVGGCGLNRGCSNLCLCMSALKARPLRQLELKFCTFTPGYL